MKSFLIFICLIVFAPPIDLEKRSLLNNQIEILVPKDFKEMSKELMDFKYPGKNRPKLILTDEGATTNIGFSLTEYPADSTMIKEYWENIKSSYQKKPYVSWKGDGLKYINGKKVGYFKVITKAIDQNIYNYIFITDVHGKLLIGTFNCVEKSLPEWEQPAEKIVTSLKATK